MMLLKLATYGWNVDILTYNNYNASRGKYGVQLETYTNRAIMGGVSTQQLKEFQQYDAWGMPKGFRTFLQK